MKIISPPVSSTVWLNLYSVLGMDNRYSYIIENVSSVGIRLSLQNETLSEKSNCILISPGEEFFIPANTASARVVTDSTYSDGRIVLRRPDITDMRSSLRKIQRLSDPRVLTQTLTQVEAGSIEGRVFYTLIDVTIPSAGIQWYNLTTPADKEFAIVLTDITPSYTGFELQLYRNSTGLVKGAAQPIKQMNKFYGSTTTVINTLTSPPTAGILEDILLYVPVAGANPSQRQTSESSRSQGYMIFPAASDLQLKLINTSGNNNRVIIKIYWLEAGVNVLES